jgi:hypothetical protein
LLTFWEERRLRIFKNRGPRKIFGPKMDETKEKWRRLHNEKLHALLYSTNIIWVIKKRRLKSAGHSARWGRGKVHTKFWWEHLWEGDHLEDQSVKWVIILKQISGMWYRAMDSIDLVQDREKWRTLENATKNLRVP